MQKNIKSQKDHGSQVNKTGEDREMTVCVRVTEHEDLSLNPQDPSKKVSIAMCVPTAPGLLGESG